MSSKTVAFRRQAGFTLVELMVAMVLGLLVLISVVYVFAGSRAAHRHQESYSAVQETGRIALELMSRDLRMAGYNGCGSVGYLTHLSAVGSNPPLQGEATFSDDLTITGIDNPAGTPDVITLLTGSAVETTLNSMPAANQFELTSAAALGNIAPGDLLLISDCVFSEVVRVQAVAGNLLTLNPPPSKQFRPDSVVMRRDWVQYTVNGPTNELFRNGVAIASGVTDLQLRYGLANPATRSVVNYVTDPSGPGIARSTTAIKVDLTVVDGNVNRPFFTTVALRNRAP